jgi:hypothetical protein
VEAIEIDNAVTLRLLFYDRDEREKERKNLAFEISKATWGSGESEDPLFDDFGVDADTERW